jgi:hypothetical protein
LNSLAIGLVTNRNPFLTCEYFSSMTTIDLSVEISKIPAEYHQEIEKKVADFFNARLQACQKGRFCILSSTPSTLEFLVRINSLQVNGFRKTFANNLESAVPGVLPTWTRSIKLCTDDQILLLDKSSPSQAKIDWTLQPGPLLVLKGDPGPETQAKRPVSNESRNMHVGLESSLSVLSGPHDPRGIVFSAAQAAQAIEVDAIGGSQPEGQLSGSNSMKVDAARTRAHAAQSSLFSIGDRGKLNTSNKLFSATRISFVLLGVNDTAKLDAFKTSIIEQVRAKTFKATIYVTLSSEIQSLHRATVNIACDWRSSMYSHTISRIIRDTIGKRFSVDGRIKLKDLNNTGTSGFHNRYNEGASEVWLQHSGVMGTAYSIPMPKFVYEFGEEVKDQEVQYLSCTTLADFRDNAEASYLLLVNVLDVLRWRFPSPSALVSEPAPSVYEPARDQSALRFDDPSHNVDTTPHPPVAATTSCASECAVASMPCIPCPQSPRQERAISESVSSPACKKLQFSDEVAQTPSGGPSGGPSCESAATGVQRECFYQLAEVLYLSMLFLQVLWLKQRRQTAKVVAKSD